jgi:hypothetical protein
LRAALADDSWPDRERHLYAAYKTVARVHNAMGIFAQLDTGTTSFHQRPYRVLGAGRFAKAVSNEIRDPQLRKIYKSVGPIGSIDQFADSTNLPDALRPSHPSSSAFRGRPLNLLATKEGETPWAGDLDPIYLIQMASDCRLRHALRDRSSGSKRPPVDLGKIVSMLNLEPLLIVSNSRTAASGMLTGPKSVRRHAWLGKSPPCSVASYWG